MSNSYNDRRARLVIAPVPGTDNDPSEYRALVDSSGFYSTADEHYFVSLVEATPFSIFANVAWPTDIYPDFAQRSLAIVVDFPQTGSYNNVTQSETRIVGFLHRDNSAPAKELRWSFTMSQNAPFKISPDVLVKKRIGVRFVFDTDVETGTTIGTRLNPYTAFVAAASGSNTPYGSTLMFSITKSL